MTIVTYHAIVGGIVNKLVADIEALAKLDCRATVLGHIQRGGSPSAADRVLATQFGHHAIELLASGAQGQPVVQENGHLAAVPIQSVAGKQRKIPQDDPLLATARAVGTCFGDYVAQSTARVSRTTVTRIWPG